ncbi:MAG TPA: hypothetical protein PLR06_09550 [Cyclobacteriaceae bacterium]|nr:hypothetical protein [Cyclobacteriaceae bacterium]
MEVKVIIWIILGLIYLFARRKKKQEPPRPARQEPEEYESTPTDRPQTFEELLREIEGMKKPEPQPEPVKYDLPPSREEKYKEITTYDYDAPAEKKQLEDTYYDYRDHDKIYEVYEDAKRQAFQRPSLEETVRLTDTIVRFEPKKMKVESRNTQASEFFSDLKDPKSFKKAFLLSEILMRRF